MLFRRARQGELDKREGEGESRVPPRPFRRHEHRIPSRYPSRGCGACGFCGSNLCASCVSRRRGCTGSGVRARHDTRRQMAVVSNASESHAVPRLSPPWHRCLDRVVRPLGDDRAEIILRGQVAQACSAPRLGQVAANIWRECQGAELHLRVKTPTLRPG